MISEVPPPMVMRRASRHCARDGELVGVAEAAVRLQAAVDDLVEQLAGEQLGHGDLLDRVLLAVEEIDGAVGEPARGLDLGGELGELMAPHLELEDRAAEGGALAAVAGWCCRAPTARRRPP